jgi:hypothetical protein
LREVAGDAHNLLGQTTTGFGLSSIAPRRPDASADDSILIIDPERQKRLVAQRVGG